MPFVNRNWNVVVIGWWNRAILTPAGIAKHLLNLPPDTGVSVMIPIDAYGPFQVKHDYVSVVAKQSQLHVEANVANAEYLQHALDAAKNALSGLPKTPVSAAGVNIRFASDSAVSPKLAGLFGTRWDDEIEATGREVSSRAINRSIVTGAGSMNVTVEQSRDRTFLVQFNFDLQSTDQTKLHEWVAVAATQRIDAVKDFLKTSLEFEDEDLAHLR